MNLRYFIHSKDVDKKSYYVVLDPSCDRTTTCRLRGDGRIETEPGVWNGFDALKFVETGVWAEFTLAHLAAKGFPPPPGMAATEKSVVSGDRPTAPRGFCDFW